MEKEVECKYTVENYSAIKKNEWNLEARSNLDGPRAYYAKWNESVKDKYHMISLSCEI